MATKTDELDASITSLRHASGVSDNITPIRPTESGGTPPPSTPSRTESLTDRLEAAQIELTSTTDALESIEDIYGMIEGYEFERGQLYALLRLIRRGLRESIGEIEQIHEELFTRTP